MNHSPSKSKNGQASQSAPSASNKPAPVAVSKEPEFVEMKLLKTYAPHYRMNDEGKLVEQDEVTHKVLAGETVSMTKAEANRAVQLQIALPEGNMYGG